MKQIENSPAFLNQFFGRAPTKGERSRLKLVRLSIEMMAKRGVDDLTLESLARRAKMSRSNVAYYFKSKPALMESLVRYSALTAQSITQGYVEAASDWKGQLAGVINGASDWARDFPGQLKVFLWLHYASSYDEVFRNLHLAIRETGAQRLKMILSLRASGGTDELAKAVQNLITGRIVDEASTKKRIDFERVKSELLAESLKLIGQRR